MPSTPDLIDSPDETSDEEDAAQINITDEELAAAAGDLDKIRSSAVDRPGSYDSEFDHRPRGSGRGPQAARHVHRVHRRARPAPPGPGGGRQLGRRGAGRLLRHDPASRSCPTAASGSPTTAAASRSRSTRRRRSRPSPWP